MFLVIISVVTLTDCDIAICQPALAVLLLLVFMHHSTLAGT